MPDLWYPWLFARLHEFIAENLPPRRGPALDAGCGTGFQSFLLARAGFDVVGFDISAGLVDVARNKPSVDGMFFSAPSSGDWFPEHRRVLGELLDRARGAHAKGSTRFEVGDVVTWPFAEASTEVITCCGSVLSFVDEYADVLAAMARGLAPGGRLFLEVEQRSSPDLLWPIVDRLSGGRLGYEQSWAEIVRGLTARPGESVCIDYPFALHDGSEVSLPIRLFSTAELRRLFADAGLLVRDRLGIHVATNLLPSTVLHEATPTPRLQRWFERLRRWDRRLGRRWPFWRLGCSVAYCLERRA
jgi:SAM-dependent methyltransferase